MQICVDQKMYSFPEETSLYEIAKQTAASYPWPVILAVADGRLEELAKPAHDGEKLSFVTIQDRIGFETMRRSYTMLFLTALQHVLRKPEDEAVRCKLHFSLGDAFFFTIDDCLVTNELLGRVDAEMRRMAEKSIPFRKESLGTEEARRLFAARGMLDKTKLFRTRLASRVNVYRLDDYMDYYYEFMAHDTSMLVNFRLYPYENGLLLQLPNRENPVRVQEPGDDSRLFQALQSGEEWASMQMIGNVADLNEQFIREGCRETILISEALQESEIASIAEKVAERETVKFVLVAGPSSSGKTTFSQRLCVQLRAHGLRPHYIGLDNYFVNREDNPVRPDGTRDYESLKAIDVGQFSRDMTDLLEGREVRMPSYDFVAGKRFYTGETLKLADGDLLVIEGIHGLNDRLTYALPKESRFRIYISALSMLSIDEHNRVPSTDGRLLRRILRDSRTRGYSAAQTLAMWESVRKGEEKNIFPFTDQADVIFNSSLPYEYSVLKAYTEPLLFQVQPDDPQYLEARRLLKFLSYFTPAPADDVPMNSILREFIGGGCFRL
jgi:uridine kinase